jgi:hypothetical protein
VTWTWAACSWKLRACLTHSASCSGYLVLCRQHTRLDANRGGLANLLMNIADIEEGAKDPVLDNQQKLWSDDLHYCRLWDREISAGRWVQKTPIECLVGYVKAALVYQLPLRPSTSLLGCENKRKETVTTQIWHGFSIGEFHRITLD